MKQQCLKVGIPRAVVSMSPDIATVKARAPINRSQAYLAARRPNQLPGISIARVPVHNKIPHALKTCPIYPIREKKCPLRNVVARDKENLQACLKPKFLRPSTPPTRQVKLTPLRIPLSKYEECRSTVEVLQRALELKTPTKFRNRYLAKATVY